MVDTAGPLRLSEFQVTGLFGEFNHQIPFNLNERVTALIGPNGLGKTACLKLINALFKRNWSLLQSTDFQRVQFLFNDRSTVVIEHLTESDTTADGSEALGIQFITKRPNLEDAEVWIPKAYEESSARVRNIDGFLPFITRISPKTWMHDSTRQTLTLQEVIENYGDRLPEALKLSLIERPPISLAEICSQIDCRLIETQRLVVFAPEDYRRTGTGGATTAAISRKAQTLKNVIAGELAVYASTSQSLDRSFPKRVLQQGPIEPSDDLRSDLAELDQVRKGLMDVGILDPEADDALPAFSEMDQAIAAVLNVFVRDTREKLGVLALLRARIQLFIELIDSRFNPKSVIVDKKNGFSVRRHSNTEVPLEKLSSGEQHQLVLFFELLFELKPNALILIDEPELSLHVAWQKQFIPDLSRIIELNKFDVLLATHSPQLIGEWQEIVVEIGEVDPQ